MSLKTDLDPGILEFKQRIQTPAEVDLVAVVVTQCLVKRWLIA